MHRFSVLAIQAIIASIRAQALDEVNQKAEILRLQNERYQWHRTDTEVTNLDYAIARDQYVWNAKDVDKWAETQAQAEEIRARE